MHGYRTTVKFRFGTVLSPHSVGGLACVRSARPFADVLLFFGSVNQVLVRLWACRGQPSLTGCIRTSAFNRVDVLDLRDRGACVQRRFVKC